MASKGPVVIRDATPALSALRNFLIGRKGTNPLRYETKLAARTQPPPNIPEGPAHRLADNYYYTHDGRREMIPPALVADNTAKGLSSGAGVPKQLGSRKGARPGNVYQWD